MRPIRATVMCAVLILVAACGTTPAESEGAASDAAQSAGPASEPATDTSAAPSSAPEPSVAPPDDDDEEPDETEARVNAERLLELFTPPNATEDDRVEGPFELAVWFTSTDSQETLITFYEAAIPAAGMEITEVRDSTTGSKWWFFTREGHEFMGDIAVRGTQVTVVLLGAPPSD